MGRTLCFTGRTVDLDTGSIAEGGSLRPMELRLLCYLASHPDRVVSREELLTEVWGYSDSSRTNTVNTTWYRLRNALEMDSDTPRHLLSIPGRGVRLAGLDALQPPASAVRAAGDALIGRADELAYLRDCGASVVVITGPSGVGKTRLALEHARGARPSGGAWVVEIGYAGSEALVVERVSAALGVVFTDPAQVGRALAMRGPTLLVLDGATDPVGPIAACIEVWTALAPELSVVVTSRSPLGSAGEQRLPLQPLGLPPVHGEPSGAAAELLLRRIETFDPQFRPDGQEEALADVLRQVDGLPLAIELAAPHVAALGADAVRAALRQGNPLVCSGDRPERHRSLHAMAEWSWATLPESARQTVRQLLAFRRSFTIAAARAVASGGPADLTLLREHGLIVPVQIGPSARFRVLETLRAIAGDPDPVAVKRHVRWYLALSAQRFAETHGLAPPDPADDPEAEELLQAALGVLHRSEMPGAAELLGYTMLVAGRTRRTEARVFAESALQHDLQPKSRVRILHYMATSRDWDPSGDILRALPDEAIAAGLFEVALDVEVTGAIRSHIHGDWDQTTVAVQNVATLARKIPPGSPLGRWADGNRAYTAAILADDPEAMQLLEYAVGRMISHADRGRIHADLGGMLHALNRTDDAIRAYEAALRELPRPSWLRTFVLGCLALTLADADRHPEAEEQMQAALALDRHLFSTVGRSMLHTMYAEVLRHLGRLDESLAVARSAMAEARDKGERTYEAHARATQAIIHAQRGDPDAGRLLCDAFEDVLAIRRPILATRLLAAMADLSPPADWMDRIDRVLRLPIVGFAAPALVLMRAECLRTHGDALAAVPMLAAAADRVPDPLRLRLRLALGAILAEHGDDRTAAELCSEAWAPADGRWTRIHRGRCLLALRREEAAVREVASIQCAPRERVLLEAIAEITRVSPPQTR